jgi:ribosome biogenesis GTPase / thiamine phosphate phosphatase
MQLELAGWDHSWSESLRAVASSDMHAGRVASANREQYSLFSEFGEVSAEASGVLLFRAEEGGLPAVGDWVGFRQHAPGDLAIIHHILPRRTKFSRRAAGRLAREQVIAANVEVVFVVVGLDRDYNPRRIERYVSAISRSSAQSVIVLNKVDLCADLQARLAELRTVVPETRVMCTSALNCEGTTALHDLLHPARTAALVGSSGVGKSTIVNVLLGDSVQRTRETRESDQRGRHTTTQRELFVLPRGGLVLDTPGMRELQIWDSHSPLENTFEDIEQHARSCAFRDCSHQVEPNCAVREAIVSGGIDSGRWNSYLKLQKELRHRAIEEDIHVRLEEKARWKRLCKGVKKMQKRR